MLELGQEGKDKITGFKGILTGMARYITGCDQYCLTPKAEKGVVKDGHYFDEGRIEITGPGITAKSVTAEANGGPSSATPNTI